MFLLARYICTWTMLTLAGIARLKPVLFVRTPLFDAYWGDRTGILVDGNGHLWSLASKIENLSQEEISNRAKFGVATVEEFVADSEIPVATYAIEPPAFEQTATA